VLPEFLSAATIPCPPELYLVVSRSLHQIWASTILALWQKMTRLAQVL
jgi:hypothetical protein